MANQGASDVDRDAMDRVVQNKSRFPAHRQIGRPPDEVVNLEKKSSVVKCCPCCFPPYYCCPPDHPLGRPVHYDVLEPYLDTGDLILFVGNDVSHLIRIASKARYSHIGMVIRDPTLANELLLLESSLDVRNDIETGQPINGCQITSLRQRLLTYESEKFAARRLLHFKRTSETARIARELKQEFAGRPFENNWVEFFKAGYDGPWGRSKGEDLNALFCSEVVAEAYERLGVLPRWSNDGNSEPGGAPSNEYAPVDFQEGSKVKLKNGWLGGEIPITFNPSAKGSKDNSFADNYKPDERTPLNNRK